MLALVTVVVWHCLRLRRLKLTLEGLRAPPLSGRAEWVKVLEDEAAGDRRLAVTVWLRGYAYPREVRRRLLQSPVDFRLTLSV